MAKTFSFSDLSEKLQAINPDGDIMSESVYGRIKEFIPTGNYALNALISGDLFKGYPSGRVTMLAGESGSGKTFLALNACREAQAMGYHVVYIDTENAIEIEGVRRFGIDPSKVSYQPLSTVNEVSQFLLNMAEMLKEKKDAGFEIPKVFVVIDSLGNLSSDKELTDVRDNTGKADFTRPKEMKRLFRICTVKLGLLDIPVICTNHTYASIGSFIPQQEVAGGSGPFYNASIILMLSKAQLKEDNKNQTGIVVTVKVKKARLTKAGIALKIHISFVNGMNRFTALEKFIDYDQCGIGAGKLIEEVVIDDTGKKPKKVKTGNVAFQADTSEKPKAYAVAHLGKDIKPNQLFRKEVFTDEVLESLNIHIKEVFQFPQYTDDLAINEFTGADEDDEDLEDLTPSAVDIFGDE